MSIHSSDLNPVASSVSNATLCPIPTEGCLSPTGQIQLIAGYRLIQCPVSRASHCNQIPLSSQAHFTGISLVCTQVLVNEMKLTSVNKGEKADLMQNLSAFQKLSR